MAFFGKQAREFPVMNPPQTLLSLTAEDLLRKLPEECIQP